MKLINFLIILLFLSACQSEQATGSADEKTTSATSLTQTDSPVLENKQGEAVQIKHASSQIKTIETATADSPKLPIEVAAKRVASILKVVVGDISLVLDAPNCDDQLEYLSACDGDNVLTLRGGPLADKPQALPLEMVWLNARKTAYRGALDQKHANNGFSFLITDVNADGDEDLIVRTGLDGAYGGASYDVFLFDRQLSRWTRSDSFTEIGMGYLSLFFFEEGKLRAESKSGCCLHIFDTYAVESNAPKLIERITEDSSAGANAVKVTKERLVDGKLQVISE